MSWAMRNGIWVSDKRDHTERADAVEKKFDELSFRVAVLEKEIDDMKLLDSKERLDAPFGSEQFNNGMFPQPQSHAIVRHTSGGVLSKRSRTRYKS